MVTEIRSGVNELVLRVAHTADFGSDELASAQRLLELVFGDDLADTDWENALGGVHVMAWHERLLVGHASLVQRRLLYRGDALRTGYVEAVAVHPQRQRSGIGGRMMDVLEGVVARAFELGALSASDVGAAFYGKRRWLQWQGPLQVLTPQGVRRSPDEDGGAYVLPVARTLDLQESLTADYRNGDIW